MRLHEEIYLALKIMRLDEGIIFFFVLQYIDLDFFRTWWIFAPDIRIICCR